MNIEGLRGAFRSMTKEQLLTVNRAVVEQIREIQRLEARRKLVEFQSGQMAWFSDKYGRKVTIRIERVNQKTVSGKEVRPDGTDGVTTWRVHASHLRAV